MPRRRAVAALGAFALAVGLLPRSSAVYTASTATAGANATGAAFSYSAAVTASSPWLWWRLGDTAGTTTADSSGNGRTATLSSTGIARGNEGAIAQDASPSFRLDGYSGCLAATASHANPTSFTLEAWFRTTTVRGGLIVGFGASTAAATGASGYDRQVFLTTTGAVAFGVKPGAASTITSPGSYNDGAWHVVHAVLGASGQKLYVDGVPVASAATTTVANVTGYWHAGCGTIDTAFTGVPTNTYLQGDLDEIAVYTSQLSAATIAARFDAAPSRQPYREAVQASRPWGWWRLGEASGTTLNDASGNGRTGTTSGSVTRLQSGIVAGDTASEFGGGSGCATIGTGVNNPTTFSLEAWFKTTSTTGGWIVGSSGVAGVSAYNSSHDRNIYMTDAGALVFGTWNGSSVDSITTASAYNDGAWHHVVATLSSAGQRLYVDGALTGTSPSTTAESGTRYWKIGCNGIGTDWPSYPSSYWFTGTLDEVAIYDQALDAQTVARHFAAASVTPSYASAVAAESPWLWYRLDERDGQHVYDRSGNQRDGTAFSGGLRSRVRGIDATDGATQFDGSTGCIVSSASHNNPNVFSIEIWFQTTTTTGGLLIGLNDAATPDLTGGSDDRHLYLTDAGNVAFAVYFNTNSTLVSPKAYNDGAWHHAVGTLSGAGQQLYVDGVLVASNGSTFGSGFAGYWHVGCAEIWTGFTSVPSNSYYTGLLDEAAVYAQALDAATVAAHYRAGSASLATAAERAGSTPWAQWRLGEASGTTLTDSSGSGHDATVSATGTTAGVAGVLPDDRARSFNGSSGCAVATTPMANPQTFSVELWFKASGVGGVLLGFSDSNGAAVGTPTSWDRLLYLLDDGRLAFGVFPGSELVATTSASYADGAWHQAVVTLGATGGQRVYVDGALQANVANTQAQTFTGWWHVGCNEVTGWYQEPGSAYFAGTIDEVAIHTVELDPATIAYRYALVTRPAATYADSVIARTPTLYWKFDQTSGNATDSSGNGRTGTASGSGITRRQLPATNVGTAWAFDGSAGCVVSASSFSNPTNYTEELWFRTTTTSGGGLIGFSDNSAATTGGGSWDRMIYMTDAGNLVLGATANNIVTSSATYNDGRWHHVAASVGTMGMRLFVDGQLVASSAYTTVVNYTGWWHAGCTKLTGWPSVPTSQYFSGTLDDVAVHDVQLSDAAIQWHYANGLMQRMPAISGASTITTIFGTGTQSNTGDGGAATSATISQPYEMVADTEGNVYVSGFDAGCQVRKLTPDGRVSTFAGTGTCSSSGDGGPATSATINGAAGLAMGPDGSLYIADGYGARIRKVAPDGTITTVAGTGTNGTTGDGGAATSAQIYSPRGIAVDLYGNLYISGRDSDRVRKVTPAGVISTLIGNGTGSSTGDGGAASSATVNFVYGVAAGPDGSVYVAEFDGCRVRKITTAGIVSTFAGTGSCGSSGDGGAATAAQISGPHGVAVDRIGNVYIAERSGDRVRRVDPNGTITTVLGNGSATSTGDGGPASSATVNDPRGLAIDQAGRLLVVDGNGNRVRRVG